jgi:hypothetical protein
VTVPGKTAAIALGLCGGNRAVVDLAKFEPMIQGGWPSIAPPGESAHKTSRRSCKEGGGEVPYTTSFLNCFPLERS